MSRRVYRQIVDEVCPFTGLNRIRMERLMSSGEGWLNGHPVSKDHRFYLDGSEVVVMTAGDVTMHQQRWEAVPARTQDVLDFGRLEMAASALTRQMAAFDRDNPPAAEQVALWLQGWANLQAWRKEAESRFTAADGQIDTVRILVRSFITGS